MTNALLEQQGFYHRRLPRSDSSLYSSCPCECYNHALHNSNKNTNHLETILFAQARGTFYEGSLLLSVMIEQTIIQAALSLIETCDGTKSKFKAWTESIENAEQISSQDTLCIAFSKITGSLLSLANRLKA